MKYTQHETAHEVTLTPREPAAATVILLHGLGADGHDFVPIVPELKLPAESAVRFVFPHAPVRPVTLNMGMRMRAWYDIRTQTAEGRADEAGIRESVALLGRYIAAERAAGIEASRIIVAGFRNGKSYLKLFSIVIKRYASEISYQGQSSILFKSKAVET